MQRSYQVPGTNRGAARNIALLAIFVAVILILTFTPVGFLNLVVIKATIVHIPVIIGSVLLGPKRGAILGFFFGLGSFLVNTMTPSLLSFAFSPVIPVPGLEHGSVWALVVCFIPRILVGIVPYWIYRLFQRLFRRAKAARPVSLILAGVFGSFTNTVFVMGLIFLLFRDAYAAIKEIPVDAVLGVVLGVVGTNGVPEAIVAAVVTPVVCLPLFRLLSDPAARPIPVGGDSGIVGSGAGCEANADRTDGADPAGSMDIDDSISSEGSADRVDSVDSTASAESTEYEGGEHNA